MRATTGRSIKRRATRPPTESRRHTLVVELGPGQHVRNDGRIVHTDMSGSVLKDENGDPDEIVSFVSPGYVRELAEE